MAAATPTKFGPFPLGVDNRRADSRLGSEDGQFLRSAVNVDVDKEGRLSRRPGTTLKVAGTDCHSLWARDATHGYYVDGTTLWFITVAGEGVFAVVARAGLTANKPMSYAKVDADVYYSNGVESGKLRDQVSSVWTLPVPAPGMSALATSGLLPPGTYRAYHVFADAAGQESAGSDVVEIALGGEAGIAFAGMPTVMPSGVHHVNVYMTAQGGDVFMKVGEAASGALTVVGMPEFGQTGRTLLLAPMPVGEIVRRHNGRMLVGLGNTLAFSEPYAFALYDPLKDFITFAAPITLIVPMVTGVYVVADATYWFPGDISAPAPRSVLPYGAVARSDCQLPSEDAAVWMSTRGLVKADDGGEVVNLQDKHIAVDASVIGATLFRETDGMRQAIATGFDGVAATGASQSFMDAEIIRKETLL